MFLTADWRYLAMLNYEVDPDLLRPLVPRGTELDTWEGKTYMSLVGFLFLNTRVYGLPIPFHRNFKEVNLRFYVRRWDGEEWRRGVVFVREIVPRQAIATVARIFYNENYVGLPMRHDLMLGAANGNVASVEYGWRYRGQPNRMRAVARGPIGEVAAGSQEEFIVNHYWGYARQRDGGTVEYEVEHEPWRRVWQCQPGRFEGDAAGLYGSELARYLREAPATTFVAEGSRINVYRGQRLRAAS